jgi:hypothetical protein
MPGLIVVVPCRASLFDGGCIGDSQRSYLSKKREKMSVTGEGCRRRDGGQRGGNVAYSHSKKASGVFGLQVDLEEEFNEGKTHVGGEFKDIRMDLDT